MSDQSPCGVGPHPINFLSTIHYKLCHAGQQYFWIKLNSALLQDLHWHCHCVCVTLKAEQPVFRSGKSTHISVISNSVTHLRSYTNTAIADIAKNSAPISMVTLCDRRCLRIERQYRCSEWPPHDRRHCRTKRARLHIENRRRRKERRYHRLEWQVFHDVSQCFKCFMMFH